MRGFNKKPKHWENHTALTHGFVFSNTPCKEIFAFLKQFSPKFGFKLYKNFEL